MAAVDFAPRRFSTDDLPERGCVPFWRDFFIRKVMLAEIEHLSEAALKPDYTLLAWPGRRTGWCNVAKLVTNYPTPTMIAECDESVSIFIKRSDSWCLSERQRDVSFEEGDAAGVLDCKSARKTVCELTSIRLFVPRCALTPLVGNVADVAMRIIPRNNESLQLLKKYVEVLPHDAASLSLELRQLAVQHIYDLIGSALSATRTSAATADTRGIRAARLQSIKGDILENLSNFHLSVATVAFRQRVTPRYIHMLFEREGVTFSEFVLRNRLIRAHYMLSNPRLADVSVSSVAFDVGFGDLSYFNRTFRRNFGETPSALRKGGCYVEPPSNLEHKNAPVGKPTRRVCA